MSEHGLFRRSPLLMQGGAGGGVLNTPGKTFLWTGIDGNIGYTTPTGISLAAGNIVRVYPVVLQATFVISKVIVQVQTAVVASNVYIGIYNSSGSKLVDSGPMSSAAVATVSSTFAPVTLPPGAYILAWGDDTAGVSLQGYLNDNTGQGFLSAATGNFGTATNTIAAGALPSTLGVIAGGGGFGIPVMMFTP